MADRQSAPVLVLATDVAEELCTLLRRYGLRVEFVAPELSIPGSFWGDSEAGLIGNLLYLRDDTPLHSALHEACHFICMTSERRAALDTDAGGDELEECAVCYLQVLLADGIAGVGKATIMRDMDTWGYSFRLGNTATWFADDAEDARAWLRARDLIIVDDSTDERPSYRLRASV